MARVHFADARPLRPMVDRTRSKQPLEGLVAIDINVAVVEILEAAKISLKDGRAVLLPLP